jgi:uncharacterized protein (TIGR02270 family)
MRELALLEERIEAHLQGLLTAGDRLLPFVEEALAGEDPNSIFAAAYALLRLHSEPALQRVVRALQTPTGKKLEGLRMALRHGPIDRIGSQIQAMAVDAPAPIAVVAMEALVFHGAVQPTLDRVQRFISDETPSVRQAGWRLVSYLGLRCDAKSYAAALRDDETGVKAAALGAAAWCGEPALLAVGRQLAAAPSPEHLEALRFLAVLGGPDDLPRIAAIGLAKGMGPDRFDLVASYGHPTLVDLLLLTISELETDPESAAAAGAAYTRLTGENIDSDRRSTLPTRNGKSPDPFEAEFQAEVTLPDYPAAYHHWQSAKPQFAGAVRMCRGMDITRGITAETYTTLDMQSRWELCLRGRFQGTWPGSPMHLELFPQAR